MRLDDCFRLRDCFPFCHLSHRIDCASSTIKKQKKSNFTPKSRWDWEGTTLLGDALLIQHTQKAHFLLFHPIAALELIRQTTLQTSTWISQKPLGLQRDELWHLCKCGFCDQCHCGVWSETQMCVLSAVRCGRMEALRSAQAHTQREKGFYHFDRYWSLFFHLFAVYLSIVKGEGEEARVGYCRRLNVPITIIVYVLWLLFTERLKKSFMIGGTMAQESH